MATKERSKIACPYLSSLLLAPCSWIFFLSVEGLPGLCISSPKNIIYLLIYLFILLELAQVIMETEKSQDL